MQLNEGCLFRVHVDADWLETDVIAIEFRLLTTSLPENEPAPTEETGPSAPPPGATPPKLKEVGSVGLVGLRSGLVPLRWTFWLYM